MKPNLFRRSKTVFTLLVMASMVFSLVGVVPQAKAALTAVGPILDPVNNGFPQFYSDENGLALQLCLDQGPGGLCVLPPAFDPLDPTLPNPATPIGTVASGAFPDESFYWIADAIIDPGVRLAGANTDIKITYRAALEQAFLAGLTPGTQNIFLRVQTDINGLVPNETYTVTHPYGTMTIIADATGGGRGRLEDMGACVQVPTVGLVCDFANPLASNPVLQAPTTNVGAFLQWDPAVLPAAPAGFIGDPNVEHQVIGGRGGVNSVTISGLSVGGVGVDTASTNLFAVAGQLADTIPPVITLNGASPMTVTAGTSYVEAGATALDNFDGAIASTSIQIVSGVPAGNLALGTGPFTVTYTVADKAGNVATATRTVTVVPDVIPPVITMNGSSTINVKVGDTFTDAGATAIDNVDGAITPIATGTVNTAIAGTYTITYTATDSSLNASTVTRTVNVAQDVTGPVITLNGTNPVSVSFGAAYTDAGATALDDFDGVRTVTVTGLPIDTRVSGAHTVTYTASDLSGNNSTSTRIVNVVPDTIAPTFVLNGTNPMTIELNTVFTDPGAVATDDVDGVRPVTATGTVNTAVTGAYTITYSASDLSGNAATITRTVNVATDATAPVITTLGANPVSILVGGTYIDAGVTAVDNIDGPIASTSIVTTGLPINTAATGTFSIVYSVADAAGNVATATRTVNVVTDIVAPVITILGANPTSITVNSTYSDAGATALDDVNGAVAVTATSTVNASVVGDYTVTYSATDAAGNTATAVRNVVVRPVQSSNGGGGFIRTPSAPVTVPTPVVIVPQPQPQPQPGQQVLGAKLYKDGSILKTSNNKLYYIVAGKKMHIRNLAELQAFISRPHIMVSQEALDQYPEFVPVKQVKQYEDGTLLKDKDTNKIFIIRNQKIVYIPNLAALAKLGVRTMFKVDATTLMQYIRF